MAKRKTTPRDGVFERRDRKGYFISFVDAQGRRRKRKVAGAHTLQQARQALAAELHKVEQAKIFGIAPPSEDGFTTVAQRYLKHQRARLTPAAFERTRGVLETHLQQFFGALKVSSIRRTEIQAYVTERTAVVSAGTVARELNVLKRLFSLALEWELIPVNPAAGVKAPRVPPGRVRYLHPGELRTLLDACPEWLRPITGFALATGMRRSEILGLRWLDVDLTGNRAVLPQTKNGGGRIVYLNQLALQVLSSIQPAEASPSSKVFGGEVTAGQVSVAFRRAVAAAGIQDFSLHDLRHCAASWMRMEGADIHTVAQLLGHRDLRMAARYQHLSPGYLADAVKGLDRAFSVLLTAPEIPNSEFNVPTESPAIRGVEKKGSQI